MAAALMAAAASRHSASHREIGSIARHLADPPEYPSVSGSNACDAIVSMARLRSSCAIVPFALPSASRTRNLIRLACI